LQKLHKLARLIRSCIFCSEKWCWTYCRNESQSHPDDLFCIFQSCVFHDYCIRCVSGRRRKNSTTKCSHWRLNTVKILKKLKNSRVYYRFAVLHFSSW